MKNFLKKHGRKLAIGLTIVASAIVGDNAGVSQGILELLRFLTL